MKLQFQKLLNLVLEKFLALEFMKKKLWGEIMSLKDIPEGIKQFIVVDLKKTQKAHYNSTTQWIHTLLECIMVWKF